MNLNYYNNTATMVEHNGTKILFDPWLVGKAYYGSWTSYPELDIDMKSFDDVDYIHISHIHPDHCHEETLKMISNDIPILIHNWDNKFVKMNLERMGKNVIEMEHGDSFKLSDGFELYVYAADGCDPKECFKFFGCGKMTPLDKSVGIDTFSVLTTGDKKIIQINDCQFPLTEKTITDVKSKFGDIDLLLVGYTGAGSYPQCWIDYSDDDKINKYGEIKRQKFLDWGMGFLDILKPKHYMPYAGTYTLCGPMGELEKFKCTPELPDALEYFTNHYGSGGFLLNPKESFDLVTEEVSAEYQHYDVEERYDYIKNILSKEKLDYDDDYDVSLYDVMELVPKAYKRYDKKRKELSFVTDIDIYIDLPNNKLLKIFGDESGYDVIDYTDNRGNHFSYSLNPKLFYRLLKGPKYAHWNNAEIGSHIRFSRYPEVYQRKLTYSMNFFHS
tara:strand:- start:7229 stop:8557 length:1329 start_codon:yes stop_codon:yes gene_type:complete